MYTLQPNLTQAQRTVMTNWMLNVLASPDFAQRGVTFPSNLGNLYIWKDGQAKMIQRGAWGVDGNYIYLGSESQMVVPAERLEIVSTFVPMCDPARSEELQTALYEGITRVLLGVYRTFQGNVVSSAQPVTQMAINPEQTLVASYMEEAWRLPNGEPVEIGPTWTVFALPTQAQTNAIPLDQ